MADWSKPTIISNYLGFVDETKNRDIDAITLQSATVVNPPVGSIRLLRVPVKFQEWNGSSFVDRVLAVEGGGTGTTSLANLGPSLGLGSMAFQNANNVGISGGTINSVGMSYPTINSASINSPTINSPSIGNATINTATINSGTLNSPSIGNPSISGNVNISGNISHTGQNYIAGNLNINNTYVNTFALLSNCTVAGQWSGAFSSSNGSHGVLIRQFGGKGYTALNIDDGSTQFMIVRGDGALIINGGTLVLPVGANRYATT